MTLVSDEEAIVIEFSKGQEPHIPKWVNDAVVSDLNVLIFFSGDVIKPNLVLSQNVKHLGRWKNRNRKDKHKEPNIREYLENNINKWRNLVKQRENIDDFNQQKWYNDNWFNSNVLHISYPCIVIVIWWQIANQNDLEVND